MKIIVVRLNLKPELDALLRERAAASGLTVEEFLSRLIEETVTVRRTDTALSLLTAWGEEDATDDREELERRRGEWASFKDAMNEGHSSDRTLFP